jgi:hypothetical protein
MAYAFNWPYFSYGTCFNFIHIYNAFNPNFIQRYELPINVSVIKSIVLTDTHDLFCIVETNENECQIFHIDLDDENPVIEDPICAYSLESVDYEEAKSFHVRGSSEKEKINQNKQLMCFMIHGSKLYVWKEGMLKPE